MGSQGRVNCPCCKICKECTGFQKILELKGSGLVAYRRKNHRYEHDFTRNIGEAVVVENTKDIKISQTDLKSAFENHQLNCAKCQQVMKHAQSLLQNVPSISKNDIISVCDHCRKKLKSLVPCFECEKIVKKFVATMGEVNESEDTQKKHFMTLLKFQNILKRNTTDTKVHLEKGIRRPLSAVLGETIPIFGPEMLRPSTGTRLAPDIMDKNRKSNRLFLLKFPEETQKARRLSMLMKETEHSFNKSLSDESFLQSKKLDKLIKTHSLQNISVKHLKPCLVPTHDKIMKLQKKDLTDISLQDVSFIRALDFDEVIEILPKDFRYLFPGDIKIHNIETTKIHVTSAELIKQTQDRLNVVAEETKRKLEELQFAREERKILAKEEKRRLAEEENKRLLEEQKQRLTEEEDKKLSKEECRKISDEEKNKVKQETYEEKVREKQSMISGDKDDKQSKKEEKQPTSKEDKLPRAMEEKIRKKEMSFSVEKFEKQRDTEKCAEDKIERQRNKDGKLLKDNDGGQRDKEVKIRREKNYNQRDKVDKLSQGQDEKQRVKEVKTLKEKDEKRPSKDGKLSKSKDEIQGGKEENLTIGKYEKQKAGMADKLIQAKDEKGGKPPGDKMLKEKEEYKTSKEKHERQSEKEGKITKNRDEKQEEGKMFRDKGEKKGQKSTEIKEEQRKVEEKGEMKRDKRTKSVHEKDVIKQEKLSKENEKLKDKEENRTSKSTTAKEQAQLKQAKADEVLVSGLLSKQSKDKENLAKEKKAQDETSRKAREAADKAMYGGVKHAGHEAKYSLPHTKVPEFSSHEDVLHDAKHDKLQNPNRIADIKELDVKQVSIMKPSYNDLILQLVKTKQDDNTKKRITETELKTKKNTLTGITENDLQLLKNHLPTIEMRSGDSVDTLGVELDIISLQPQDEEVGDIIIGEKIYKKKRMKALTDIEEILPIQCKTEFIAEPLKQDTTPTTVASELDLAFQKVKPTKSTEPETKGVIRYALSDRSFIDKGWTLLPTEKVVRKMNVYRMRPAHPEFDWFEHNKNKRLMTYDSGEKLAEFDDSGRGRWYYRNGRLALDYYDSEEAHAQQRFVIYSSGEPDERGRGRPYTVLATFDYLGNGVVFDHAGKIRLKYNQTEGVILDRGLGPVSHWKWHSLNDPPVLQQVMIDTQLAHKDPEILQIAKNIKEKEEDKIQVDNEEMLAIEFDNFIKEKSMKLTQKFKPFQIKMKALKLNEHFSLKVLDQATIYLIFRDGTTNLKLNLGMILDHQEIVDTDTAEVGEVASNVERWPARSESIAGLQRSVAYAQRAERLRVERVRRVTRPQPCASADRLAAAAARALRLPLLAAPSASTTATTNLCSCRKPPSSNLYYDTRLI